MSQTEGVKKGTLATGREAEPKGSPMSDFETQMDLLKQLDLDGDYPPSFKFRKEGDEITGTVLRWSEGEAMNGPAPICTLATDADELASVWITQQGLRSEVEKKNPKVGEQVTFRYIGERTSTKNGQTWKKFVVVVDRDEPEVNDFHSLIGKAKPAAQVSEEFDPFEDEDAPPTPYAQQTMRRLQ